MRIEIQKKNGSFGFTGFKLPWREAQFTVEMVFWAHIWKDSNYEQINEWTHV